MNPTRRSFLRTAAGLLLTAPLEELLEPRRKLWPGHDFVSGIRLKKIVGDVELTPEAHSRMFDPDFQEGFARLLAEYVREQAVAERRLIEAFRSATPLQDAQGGRYVEVANLFELPRGL